MSLDAGRVGVRADQVDIHGRVTSPSFLNELLESLPEWTDMPVWVNGTEELLPSNNSVPVTSPILADIAYPDIRRDNQYFTYRESPTPVDSLAKIKSIKGNTLVWNQLLQNGNFVNTNGWNPTRGTITANNNICQFTATETGSLPQSNRINYPNLMPIVNHSYLVSTYIKAPRNTVGSIGFTQIDYWPSFNLQANVKTKVSTIYTFSNILPNINLGIGVQANENDVVEISNVQMFDLTQMGLDSITSVEEFASLFPLPYYSYNAGTLLSFNGTGIKTVGKNLVFKTITNSSINGSGEIISTSNFQMSVAQVLKGKEYVITTNDNSKKVLGFYYEEPVVGSVSYNGERIDDSSSYVFTSPITGYVAFRCLSGYSTPMLEFGSVASEYEPYTSHTTSLPISTYFPTGMKSARNVYDELTGSKAYIRTNELDLGSLSWNKSQQGNIYLFVSNIITDMVTGYTYNTPEEDIKIIGIPYDYKNLSLGWDTMGDKTFGMAGRAIRIRDDSFADATAFKNAMSGKYITYELATPIELPTLSLGE